MNNKKRTNCIRKITAAVLVVCMTLTLCGCRQTPVLQKIVYSLSGPVDEQQQRTNNNENNDQTDPNLPSKSDDKTGEVERDFDYTVPVKGDQYSPLQADDEVYGNTREERSVAQTQKTSSQNEIADTDDVGSVEENEILAALEQNLREIVDATEQSVKIPQNVEKVSAVGAAALYVEMLGGRGRLAATSEDFKTNPIAAAAFGQEEIDSTAALWTKDGSTALGSKAFEQLVEIVRPEVCFVVSQEESFSDQQLADLAEEDIYIITLPKLNTTENIFRAVDIIAQVLEYNSDDEETTAAEIAAEYKKWYTETVNGALEKDRLFSGYEKIDFNNDCYANYTTKINDDANTDGYYTLYISDWDEGASYAVSTGTTEIFAGTGMAIAPSGYSTTPLAYYMSLGGMCNTAALSADLFTEMFWYVSPLTPASMAVNKNAGTWDRGVNKTLTEIDSDTRLGSKNFNIVIAGSNTVRERLVEEYNAEMSLWKNYGLRTINEISGYGIIHNSGFIYSNVVGEYTVAVNPCGAGKWTEGSPEAPLEILWINSLCYGDYDEEYIRSEIADFYSRFYRCQLTDKDIDRILAGAQ